MKQTNKPKTTSRTWLSRLRILFSPKARRALNDKRVHEAYNAGYNDAMTDEPPLTLGGKSIGRGYRSMRMTVRDETATSQEAAIERSYRQFATNPLAWSTANIGTDYVWDDNGPTIAADHPDVQAVLDAHWKDDVNDWPGKGSQRVRDLRLYGEWVSEAFVRRSDGRVRLGTIDPAEIQDIITDADNRDEIIALRLKGIQWEQQSAGRLLKVICQSDEGLLTGVETREFAAGDQYEVDNVLKRGDKRWRVVEANQPTDKFESGWSNVRAAECCYGRAYRVSEAAGTERRDPRTGARLAGRIVEDSNGTAVNGDPYDGQVFLLQINKTSIGLRGRPDGLALIDWLDRYDQMFFDILEHAALLKDIVWDLLTQGGDDTEITKQINKFVAAVNQAGRVYGHNEKVTLNLISGGSRYPVYMLGSGGDANLATATAQGGPTYKGFKTRQGVVRRFIERILRFVLDQAIVAGRLPAQIQPLDEHGEPSVDQDGQPVLIATREAFSVTMPEISPKDTAAAATTFVNLVNAVITAYTAKLLPRHESIEIIARGADLLGIELEVDKIIEALDSETMPAPTGVADALGGGPSPNEQTPSDDLGQLLGVMNAGAADEVKQQ